MSIIGKKIFITGGAGFIGSTLIGRLIKDNHITIYDNFDFDTQIIVASIRNPIHVLEAALMGADIATIPYTVLEQLAKHPLTDVGIERFLEDWKKIPKK